MSSLSRGLSMALATTASMIVASTVKTGRPWGGLNAMASIVTRDASPPKDFDLARTPLGAALAVGGLFAWGATWNHALKVLGKDSTPLTGALSALLGLAVDRVFLPKELLPNFRASMGAAGTAAKYVVMAVSASYKDE